MSKFLMAMALFIPVLFPILQFFINEINHVHMKNAIEIVQRHVQIARTDGYFTPDNIESMKTELSNKCNVSVSDIIVNVTTTPKYRFNAFDQREMIDYEVQIPIHKIIAMASYLGFTEAENQGMYPIKGSAPSEVLAP